MLTGEEAVRADLGDVVGAGSGIGAAADTGLELTEGPDGQQRARLRPDLDQVHERHLINEAERRVAHALGAGAVQLGVDGPASLVLAPACSGLVR